MMFFRLFFDHKLHKFSQKYPGVTVSDIKKWNDIQDGNIRPGMKLKIII